MSVDPQYIGCDLQLSHQSSSIEMSQLPGPPTLGAGTSISVDAHAHHSRPSNIALDVSKPTQDTMPVDSDPQFSHIMPRPNVGASDDAITDSAGDQKSTHSHW